MSDLTEREKGILRAAIYVAYNEGMYGSVGDERGWDFEPQDVATDEELATLHAKLGFKP